jgi:hypothetical protein
MVLALPSRRDRFCHPRNRRFGLETRGILSGKLNTLTYHINLGGGLDREKTNPFFVWGMIGELGFTSNLRLVNCSRETRKVLVVQLFSQLEIESLFASIR